MGRLTLTEAQGVDQFWVTYGLETNDYYTHTDSTGSGALYYEAESRTAMGGSATAAGPSGASGAGSNVMRNTSLGTSYQPVLSTQASGGGSHLTHVGAFRVYARFQVPTSNAGTVSVALEWSVGDFRRPVQNATVDLDTSWEGTWRLADLGLVSIPKVLTGTQRWEGRVLARSTAGGDDIDVDHLMLVPVGIGSGIAQAGMNVGSQTLSARDEFDQAAGALNAKTLPVGGTWATSGVATDFSVVAGSTHALQRTTTADASTNGRFAIAGTTSFTNILEQVDLSFSSVAAANVCGQGLVARYVDANNWLRIAVQLDTVTSGLGLIGVQESIAGTPTTLRTFPVSLVASLTYTLRVAVDAAGRVFVYFGPQGSPSLVDVVQSSNLATGGTLASGNAGLNDFNNSGVANTRTLDNFWAAVGVSDAAMFASQSLEIRHDGVIREDSAGAIWQDVSSYEGDLLKVPPTGREQRSVRFIVKASRNDPTTGPDSAIDDINATLAVTPRYLSVPAPV